jgi:hypothetical protein
MKEIPALKEMFFNAGKENNASEQLLNYVWHCFSLSLGYGLDGPSLNNCGDFLRALTTKLV